MFNKSKAWKHFWNHRGGTLCWNGVLCKHFLGNKMQLWKCKVWGNFLHILVFSEYQRQLPILKSVRLPKFDRKDLTLKLHLCNIRAYLTPFCDPDSLACPYHCWCWLGLMVNFAGNFICQSYVLHSGESNQICHIKNIHKKVYDHSGKWDSEKKTNKSIFRSKFLRPTHMSWHFVMHGWDWESFVLRGRKNRP